MAQASIPTIVTIGESMVLVAPTAAEPLEHALDVRLDVGGAESNIASHLVQLGHPTAWVSDVGDDPLGRRLLSILRRRGVDLSFVQTGIGPTGVYFKDPGEGVHYYRTDSAAAKMSPATLNRVPLEGASLLHISGITPALSASCADLIDTAVKHCSTSKVRLSFDVNYRAALWSIYSAAPTLYRLASQADIVFVGRDEAETLWGASTPEEIRELFRDTSRLIVKDADIGATEYTDGGSTFVPAIPCEIVEAVGAGDAFAAGYLAADLEGADAKTRLQRGHAQAAMTLASTSDVPEIGRTAPDVTY